MSLDGGRIAMGATLEQTDLVVGGAREADSPPSISLAEALDRALVRLAESNAAFVVVDADRTLPTFGGVHPGRVYRSTGAQDMIAVADGLARSGQIPIVTARASACLRCLDLARLSIAHSRRNVKIVGSRSGLDACDDEGALPVLEDLAVFRSIPGMVVVVPADPRETELAARAVLQHDGPVYMRTGSRPARPVLGNGTGFELGRGSVLREGSDVTLVACGVQVARALDAADGLARLDVSARVVNLSTIKPLDEELIVRCAVETGCIVTAEDHNVHGGLGSAVAETLVRTRPCPVEVVAIDDRFGVPGDPRELASQYGLTGLYIEAAAQRAIRRKHGRRVG